MRVVLVTLALLALALSGCTSDDDSGDDPYSGDYDGPEARVDDKDVPIDGSNVDIVSCGSETLLIIQYQAGPDKDGDFTVNVRAESSNLPYDEDGNGGIPVYPTDQDPQNFPGDEDGFLEVELGGTEGDWLLKVDRSQEHDGNFVVRLRCA